ncbi:MAG: hypothetical protein M1817_005967 [Caeruleum heppii]|nr:MAG: hypothetical protein M1817_005967 [Caeruleum heppii]
MAGQAILAEPFLEPNPAFTFPMKPSTTATELGSSSAPTRDMHPRAGLSGKTGSSRKSVSALPMFDFHSSHAAERTVSPAASPVSPIQITGRTGGHRRGGSEFIGGDGKKGGPGLMSASPTKGDGVLPPPSSAVSSARPAGRRGHAHRRSGAISCHDLSMISRPAETKNAMRAGSAPTSPSEVNLTNMSFRPFSEATHNATETQPQPQEPTVSPHRARVGFSDTLEFIPRPLSILSSESSSTMNTVRGHSVSGSMSSLVSVGTSPPRPVRAQDCTPERAIEAEAIPIIDIPTRPNTAGAVMSKKDTDFDLSAGLPSPSLKRSKSVSGSPKLLISGCGMITPGTSPQATNFNLFRSPALQSPSSLCPTGEATKSELTRQLGSPPATPTAGSKPSVATCNTSALETNALSSPERKSERKSGKGHRIVKTWAGSILSRKAKHRTHKSKVSLRRSPTPPSVKHVEPVATDPILELDNDRTCTIVSESP